jgi:hypothetical protein
MFAPAIYSRKQWRKESYKNPFTPSLDELVQEHSNVCQHEATDVEAKELGSMTGTELEADLSLVGMSKPGIFNLTCYLI